MEVQIQQIHNKLEFTATNGKVNVPIVAKPLFQPEAEGFRPMELMLSALGSCLSIDLLLILQKQRQSVKEYHLEVQAERSETPPTVFTKIILNLYLKGDLEAKKVDRALELSKEICPAYATLSKTAQIECNYFLNHE